jgi:hypothetical protein
MDEHINGNSEEQLIGAREARIEAVIREVKLE